MDTREDPFFTTLLQEGSTLGSPYFESPYSSQIFPESQLNVQTEPQPKKSRGVNFTVDEDNMLVSAWLNTSLDAVHGNDQKNHTFWKRIWECYHSHKTFVNLGVLRTLFGSYFVKAESFVLYYYELYRRAFLAA